LEPKRNPGQGRKGKNSCSAPSPHFLARPLFRPTLGRWSTGAGYYMQRNWADVSCAINNSFLPPLRRLWRYLLHSLMGWTLLNPWIVLKSWKSLVHRWSYICVEISKFFLLLHFLNTNWENLWKLWQATWSQPVSRMRPLGRVLEALT